MWKILHYSYVPEIPRLIESEKDGFQKLCKLLSHRKISLETKKQILKAYVISVFISDNEY